MSETVRDRNKYIYFFLKRLFDLIISVLGTIILSPLFLLIMVFIKVFDFGPVFYRAERVGLNGIMFRMLKFRTMIVNAHNMGPSSATVTDRRITLPGSFLRRYKLDELPQLLNVIVGDMSIIGPRPEEKKFTDLFTNSEKLILSVKPGITDWASLWNSNESEVLEGSADPDRTYMEYIRPKKIELQLKYVNNNNFMIDLKIFILTLLKLFFGIKI